MNARRSKRKASVTAAFTILFLSSPAAAFCATSTTTKRRRRRPAMPLYMSANPNQAPRTWAQKKTANRELLYAPDTSPTYTGSTVASSLYPKADRRIERRKLKSEAMPVTGYNPEALDDYFDRHPWKVAWRLNSIGFPLLGWYLGLLMDKALGMDTKEHVQRKRGEELRHHLVQSKSVALIKSGQAISLRPDLIRNKIWAEELGKLVDAVGSFDDKEAMKIIKKEFSDIAVRLDLTKPSWKSTFKPNRSKSMSSLEKMVATDDVLSLFEFYNSAKAVASASIGQVYKARIRRGAQLEAAIGKEAANKWGGKIVAVKVQRPDVEESASLDMYLLRRTAMWLSKVRGGDLTQIADAFGMQLFGELDYIREADNCERFGALYDDWNDVQVPSACLPLTRKRVLVIEWVDGEKGPWDGQAGIELVRTGLRCCVDQLMTTGLFHADPHRGNLLKTSDGKLAFIDFGMMADIDEEERYGLFGLAIGLQNKDLPLVTENLLKVCCIFVSLGDGNLSLLTLR